jgi:hypothetical protein
MAFEYTANDLIKWLKEDKECNGAWPFIIERLLKLKHRFEVEWLIGRDFDGGAKKAFVSTGANDRAQATEWAKDALREWAGSGVMAGGDDNYDYFSLIAREFANEGPGKGNTAKSIGTTLDFLFLLSRSGGKRGNYDMYRAIGDTRNVPEILCFVYANMYNPTDQVYVKLGLASKDNHLAAIPGGYGSGPKGLKDQYYDSDDNEDDQTHHFAAYFCHGASHGMGEVGMHVALYGTSDKTFWRGKIINQGDYDLGWVGAKWGDSFRRKPRFIGKEVEDALQRRDDNVKAPVPD